jgi:hypothetical protein
VHDGKLFLFLNAQTRDLFLKDVVGVTDTADENWERIESVSVAELAAS